ncbi:GNAT family N-acetyltransferase [Hoeflea sp. TYP-13]|uniref:GNAT family N-acetyltransferase n=1 Tax=Hoeflea sp. TYP-13 TaxID=3230023 RepID=UPI0034C65C79
MLSENYTFSPVTEADFPTLTCWLQTPEVRRWWGDPDHELSLIKEDLNDPRMANLIVVFDDRPFAYAQHYEIHSWPHEHLSHLPRGTRAIDTFIGEPDMIGVGHGSGYLHALANQLLKDGACGVVIDPDPQNVRARRAYEKAGFIRKEELQTSEGPAVVMHFVP